MDSEAIPVTIKEKNRAVQDLLHNYKPATPRSRLDDPDTTEVPAKRMKIAPKGKFDIDCPISPIASTSGLYQSNVNHTFDLQNDEDFAESVAGPSGLQNQRYGQSSSMDVQTTSASADVKANGATDDHSESSESTSGCSSLVPQSDRLSQSAYICTSRKKNLEEKLSYGKPSFISASPFLKCEVYSNFIK